MKTSGFEEIVARLDFFRDFDSEHVRVLAGCASSASFGQGEYLFREGGEADRFYVILEGTVALELYTPGGGPLVIETIQGGGVVGWSWIIPPYHWRMDGLAATDVRALVLDGKCLRGKAENDPPFGFKLLSKAAGDMAHALDVARIRLLDLYGGNKK